VHQGGFGQHGQVAVQGGAVGLQDEDVGREGRQGRSGLAIGADSDESDAGLAGQPLALAGEHRRAEAITVALDHGHQARIGCHGAVEVGSPPVAIDVEDDAHERLRIIQSNPAYRALLSGRSHSPTYSTASPPVPTLNRMSPRWGSSDATVSVMPRRS
jgi:hypothetical protein